MAGVIPCSRPSTNGFTETRWGQTTGQCPPYQHCGAVITALGRSTEFAHLKNMDANHTVKTVLIYGTKKITLDAPVGSTPKQILSASYLKTGLGYGDNIRAMKEGVDVTDIPLAQQAETVELRLETKANSKA